MRQGWEWSIRSWIWFVRNRTLVRAIFIFLDWPMAHRRKAVEGLRPSFFGPRIPDFLSRLVALSNFMRLSLRESRMRGRRLCCAVGNPGNAGANMGHPCRAVELLWSCGTRHRLAGQGCGIPHLAKNERDVGHPAVGARIELKSASLDGYFASKAVIVSMRAASSSSTFATTGTCSSASFQLSCSIASRTPGSVFTP
jgi:hypothetical protein